MICGVGLEDVVEEVGVLAAVAGDEGIVEELVLDGAGLGGIAGGGLHRLAQHHEGRRLLVRQPGHGGDDVAAGDEEEVVDPLGVDVVGGVDEVAALDHRPAVAGPREVVEIDAAVAVDGDVLQEGVLAEAGVVGLPLLAGVEAVGFDEQAAGLEAAEAAVRDSSVPPSSWMTQERSWPLRASTRQLVLVLPLALRATISE